MQEYSSINDGDLNPEVQLELEKLNTASAQINELENKLQELRNSYYETLSKCTAHLTELSNKIGNNIILKVRPYVYLKRQQIEIQKESQIAATRYEAACIQLSHSDAVVTKNEALAKESPKLDDSAMEILNIAISKVNLSKLKKTEAHNEHQFYLNKYRDMEERIRQLERKHKNDIIKAKPYFNYSKYMDERLKESKLNIDVYEDKVRICKLIYNDSLQRLEDISNDIHRNRENNHLLGPRGEGVGAELVTLHCDTDNKEQYENNKFIISNNTAVESTTSKFLKPPNYTGKKKANLNTSTPIVDGLLEVLEGFDLSIFSLSSFQAISLNYSNSYFHTNDDQSQRNYQNDFYDKMKSEFVVHLDDFNFPNDYIDDCDGNALDEI